MGKKTKPYQIMDNEDDDEELSDLEILEEDGQSHKKIIEGVNETEQLDNFTKNIKQDFNKIFTSKGKTPKWIETMIVTSKDQIDSNLNVEDDIKRELIFYNLTIKNAVEGIGKLKECHEKINRPEDFFAEMMKSDNQMARVKKQIITEQQRIKKFEEKKQKMHNIKFSKHVCIYTQFIIFLF
jgi:rRNA-processing protein EBP2